MEDYVDQTTKIEVLCENGHPKKISPKMLNDYPYSCRDCKLKIFDDKLQEIIKLKGGRTSQHYVTKKEKVRIFCSRNHPLDISLENLEKGTWCEDCRIYEFDEENNVIGKKTTTRRNKQEMIDLLNEKVRENGGKVIGKYQDSMELIKIECGKGHIREMRPADIIYGRKWCLICADKSSEEAEKKFIAYVVRRGGKVIGKYLNSVEKVAIECEVGHPFDAIPANTTYGENWCPRCTNCSPEQAKEKFFEALKRKEAVLKSEYVDTKTKVNILCSGCDRIFSITPGSVTSNGQWCSRCSEKSSEQAKERTIEIIERKEGKMLTEYINNHTKVLVECSKGDQWWVEPNSLKSMDSWCPLCASSKGEKRITEWLIENNIEFVTQAWIRYKGHLHYFDFWIPSLDLLIEFDGEQHFEEGFFGSGEKFLERRERDLEKDEYASRYHVHMIRIPYWLIDRIEECLENIFNIFPIDGVLSPDYDYFDKTNNDDLDLIVH